MPIAGLQSIVSPRIPSADGGANRRPHAEATPLAARQKLPSTNRSASEVSGFTSWPLVQLDRALPRLRVHSCIKHVLQALLLLGWLSVLSVPNSLEMSLTQASDSLSIESADEEANSHTWDDLDGDDPLAIGTNSLAGFAPRTLGVAGSLELTHRFRLPGGQEATGPPDVEAAGQTHPALC
jgi:hypothetical protein